MLTPVYNSYSKWFADSSCLNLFDSSALHVQTKAFYCTVSVVDPVVPPELAPMIVVPAAMQLAWPPTLGAFAMVATVACDELQ